ncbi:hypothetical protein KEM52_004983 [Ascosphaera acerosa]|nr:hypothetical protein KEM52_004983 [Ascosphaera acerosa]
MRFACRRAMRASVASSCFALRKLVGLCLPYSARGTTNDSAIPLRPARPVRPIRCMYARELVGRSKFSTHATSRKSIPREMP